MSSSIVVLKFGGSVLQKTRDTSRVVHEIYRWVREGHRVVAIVSAIGNRTNELLEQADAFGCDTQDKTRSLLVSTGELQSAALVGLELDRSGIANCVLTANQLQLETTGDHVDAKPSSVDTSVVLRALQDHSAVVIPGFLGQDEALCTTLLGRGGSDLTAIFLAHHLQAERCRLIKDVDGLYEYDPKLLGPKPSRFKALSWHSALRLDETIVQHKAIEFAQAHDQAIEVASLNSTSPTVVTSVEDDAFFADKTTKPRPRVGLLGFGVVGKGVFQRLQQLSDQVEVTGIVVRDHEKAFRNGAPSSLIYRNAKEMIELSNCEIVFEAFGGVEDSLAAVRYAIEKRLHVVTANKSLIALHGTQLQQQATENGVALHYSSSVGGGVPAIELIDGQSDAITQIQGVVNGTANFVLEQIQSGKCYDTAVELAQCRGLAESDPTRDLDGTDAAQKLIILARHAGYELEFDKIKRQAITPNEPAWLSISHDGVAKQVAGFAVVDGEIDAWVSIESLPRNHVLANVTGAENYVAVVSEPGNNTAVSGRGAGRWPTAESVVADLLSIVRSKFNGREPASEDDLVQQRELENANEPLLDPGACIS